MNHKRQLSPYAIIVLVVVPLILVSGYLIFREYKHQTEVALERRAAIANLGATLMHEKLDSLVDLGISLASRLRLAESIKKDDWTGAVDALAETSKSFPYIDTVGLMNKEGVIKAVAPPIPEAIGKSFAYRDYYQGVSKDWEPYVSEAFLRAVDPKYRVITAAIPIRPAVSGEVLGILLLTIKLDTVVGWSRELDAGEGSFAYVVDKKGQLVAHPNLKSDDSIPNTDYSSVPTVQKLTRGERGVEVIYNPIEKEERVTAYAPVVHYNFGVAVVQPTRVAFAERTQQVVMLAVAYATGVLLATFFFYWVLREREAMRIQRDRERAILESIGDGIVVIDRDWRITLWNKAATAITGWNEEEVIGKPFRSIVKFIRENDRKEEIAFIEDAIVMKKTSFMDVGTILTKKDGSEIPVGDSAAPIIDQDGEVRGVIIVFRDASKERETMHMRSEFVYASHQLRTPVTEALWNLDVAKKGENPEKINESLDIIGQSLQSIQRLSEHLVSASEIDQGALSVKKATVRIIDIMGELQNALEKKAKEKGTTLSFSPVSVIAAFDTDPKLFKKILYEVLDNAILYSPEGAEVKIDVFVKENDLVIEVIDSGVGIPESEQPVMFTKFFRASNRPKSVAGSGLGLYIAREYVKVLGGKIWFESEEGRGTTFFVSLPLH